MLKITVSLIPGGVGRECVIGELLIANVGGAAHADYECVLISEDLPEPRRATVRRYPRWSATVPVIQGEKDCVYAWIGKIFLKEVDRDDSRFY